MREKNHKHRGVTIIDVAREAQVSYSTVSRVLTKPTQVKADKRERVLAAIDRLGYVANLQARSLVGGRTQLIGLIVHDLIESYTDEVVRGIDEELTLVDYNLILFTTHHNRTKELHYARTLTQGLVDGLLLSLPLAPTTYLAPLAQQGFPYVVIDHHGFDDFSLTVTATNWQGAYDATTYLLNLGHRRIAHIMGNPAMSSAGERLAGYQAALEAQGIPCLPELIEISDFQYTGGIRAAQALLNLPEPPTAIFASNDVSALGAIEVIRSQGLSIPDDISIVGFDDIPQAAHLRPPLTTVRQPLADMGRVAVRMLLKRLQNPPFPLERIVLETSLVIRDSCGPYQTKGMNPGKH